MRSRPGHRHARACGRTDADRCESAHVHSSTFEQSLVGGQWFDLSELGRQRGPRTGRRPRSTPSGPARSRWRRAALLASSARSAMPPHRGDRRKIAVLVDLGAAFLAQPLQRQPMLPQADRRAPRSR